MKKILSLVIVLLLTFVVFMSFAMEPVYATDITTTITDEPATTTTVEETTITTTTVADEPVVTTNFSVDFDGDVVTITVGSDTYTLTKDQAIEFVTEMLNQYLGPVLTDLGVPVQTIAWILGIAAIVIVGFAFAFLAIISKHRRSIDTLNTTNKGTDQKYEQLLKERDEEKTARLALQKREMKNQQLLITMAQGMFTMMSSSTNENIVAKAPYYQGLLQSALANDDRVDEKELKGMVEEVAKDIAGSVIGKSVNALKAKKAAAIAALNKKTDETKEV